IKEASIEPYAEYIVEPSERLELLEKIEQLYEETSSGLSEVNKTALEDYYNTVTHPDLLSDYIAQFAHLLDNHNQSLLDYLGPNHRVFADDITAIKSAYDAEFEAVHNYFSSVLEAGQMFKGGANYLEGQYERLLNLKGVTYLNLFMKSMPVSIGEMIKISVKPTEIYYGQYDILASNLNSMLENDYLINIILRDQDELNKTKQLLDALKIPSFIEDIPVESGIVLTVGETSNGFISPYMATAILTSKELYNKTHKKKKRRQKLSNAEKIKSYQEINTGDYIVHVHHGVGRYLGIETVVICCIHSDYMKLQYKGTDQLYIPVDQMDLVQKYVSSDDGKPKMHKLGGVEWKRTKAKVEANVNDIAEELIRLYQERA